MAGYVADFSQPLMRNLHDFRFLFPFALLGVVLLLIVMGMVGLSSRIAAIALSLFALGELIETIGLVVWRIGSHTFQSVWIIDGALLMLTVGVMGVMLNACMATFTIHRMRSDDTEILSVFE